MPVCHTRNTPLLPALAAWALLLALCAPAAARTAVVTADALHLRAEPSREARVLATLKKGTRVEVVADQGQWLKVRRRKTLGYLFNRPEYVRVESAGRPGGAEGLRRQSQDLRGRIRSRQQAVSEIKARETGVLSELDRMDREIDHLRRRRRRLQAQLRQLDTDISRADRRLRQLNRRIADVKTYAAARLTALYKLERLGRIELLASADSFYTLQLRRRALQEILHRDREVLTALAADQARQQELIAARRRRLAEKKRLEKTARDQLAELKRRQRLRRRRLAEIRSRKSLELAALKALRVSARRLDRELRALERKAPPAAPEPAPPPTLPRRDRHPHKSLPNIPVKGKIIGRFGPYRDPQLHFESYRNGIDIRAERGAPIRSVAAGVVRFAQWFRGYGNVIIIDHGSHFYSVYAHIDEFFKQTGDRVERGEVIATVGDTGSLQGPMLYFEIRRNGKPVDPRRWVGKG